MDLFISRKQIMRELRLNESSEHKIRVDCVVTENLTSIVYNSSAKMEYKQSKILIDVLSKPRVVKPGLRYQALVFKITFCFNQIIATKRYRSQF